MGFIAKQSRWSTKLIDLTNLINTKSKDIQIILWLFLVIAMYCQASSSKFYQSLNLSGC